MAKKRNPKKAVASSIPQVQPAADAEALKEAGNTLFKARDYRGAAEKYSQAHELDPSVAVYSGNLSAALTEDGAYVEAILAIRQAEAIIRGHSSKDDTALLGRLSDRLGRCLYHATQKNLSSPAFLSENQGLIGSLRPLGRTGATSWWDRYDRIYFDALPCRKGALNTNVEFFTIGHDRFRSLLQGFLDGWGPNRPSEGTCPGDSDVFLDKSTIARYPDLSFLFGGVGDARHVFSTFLDICAQETFTHVGMHFTLIDIQPAALARDLVFLSLLWNTPSDDYERRVISAKTAFYMFSCVAMPPDSHALLMKICGQLTTALDGTGPSLPPFILIDPELVPALIACLEFWLHLPSTISTPKVLKHARVDPASLPPHSNIYINRERVVYSSLKVLLPPYTTAVDALEEAHDQVEYGAPKPLGGVRQHIEKTWKPNPTFFDKPNHDLYLHGHYPLYFDKLGSPNNLVVSALDTLFTRLGDLGKKNGVRSPDPRWPSFSRFHDILFAPLCSQISGLGARQRQAKFEFIAGDVVRFMALLKSGSPSLDWRERCPRSFTRAWMSNVPDYAGGILEMALYAVPCLQPTDLASVGMNCLFNGPVWKNNFKDFVYTYTLLLPEQLPKFLGCTIRWYHNVPSILYPPFCLLPCKLPLKQSQLASRVDFDGWLHRVLLRILAPPSSLQISSLCVLMPTTFRTFIQLLLHAVEIGYPPGWISDILHHILSDTLDSSWRPHSNAPMAADTIHKQYPTKKLQLSSWMADIEVVVASALPLLPRELDSQHTLLSPVDTAVFQATLRDTSPGLGYPQNPGLALVFSAPGFNLNSPGFKTQSTLFSEAATGDDVQIFFSILTCDIDAYTRVGTVSWRMSIPRFEKMKNAGWVLYFWHADIPFIASKGSKASEWKRL